MKMRVLDLFSGIGGFSLGLERTGYFETVAFCEIDKKARQVLRKHWKDVHIFEDVTTLRGDQIGTVELICGGFPCQDLSLAGKGAGLEGARSGLWWEFHRLIKEIRPQWVIAENVAAIRSRGLDQVLSSLAQIGYDAEWHCIPASAVGAPHQRDRVWIVAYPQCHGFPAATVTGGVEETVRQESARQDNALDFARTSCIPTTETNVAHSGESGRQGWLHRWADTQRQGQLGYLGRCSTVHGQPIEDWWSTESEICRVVNGLSGRVDRLKQLGNAVVPQIPELIGRAIAQL
jgi:DNA (cytosine-5)-methyltransferase 1